MSRTTARIIFMIAISFLVGCENAVTAPSSVSNTQGTNSMEIDACIRTQPSPPEVHLGSELVLDGSCSSSNRAIDSFSWDLGDGRKTNGAMVNAKYTEPGTYTVTLQVQDVTGAVDTEQTDVRVAHVLEACFVANPPVLTMANVLCTLEFDASCSKGEIAEFQWFFEGSGDDHLPDQTVTTEAPTVSHSWEDDPECFGMGHLERRVRLTVVDEFGFESTTEKTVHINEP